MRLDGGAGRSLWFDVFPFVAVFGALVVAQQGFYFRGVTYRKNVLPFWKERLWKSVFYASILGIFDSVFVRSGQALAHFGLSIGPSKSSSAFVLRSALLHIPWLLWAALGPLSSARCTRDDRCFSESARRFWLWSCLAKRVFGHASPALSEEWRDIPESDLDKHTAGQFLIAMHPHGLLPIGAIICGLTWGGGGLGTTTSSGVVLPERSSAGLGLHQRWFPDMQLRAAVASGACSLLPIFYELFSWLGAFECTKPFISSVLRSGRSVALFPGGAKESSYASPGRYVCLIKKRKGFCRLALEERRNIIPMWTFGDEALAPQLDNPPRLLRLLHRFFRESLGLLVPPVTVGLFRFPPLTMVAGIPIPLEDLWAPEVGGEVSDAAVEEAHQRYMKAVQQLFDRNKAYALGDHGKGAIEMI